MYTVVRFFGVGSEQLQELRVDLNAFDAGFMAREDRGVNGRISCPLSHGHYWLTHYRAIMNFMKEAEALISKWYRRDVEMQFDVAVYPQQDAEEGMITSLAIDEAMAEALARRRISLVFSLYDGDGGG